MSEEDVIVEANQTATGDDGQELDADLATGELSGEDGELEGKSPAQMWAEADGLKEKAVVAFVVFVYVAIFVAIIGLLAWLCLLYTSPSPRDQRGSRMPSSA